MTEGKYVMLTDLYDKFKNIGSIDGLDEEISFKILDFFFKKWKIFYADYWKFPTLFSIPFRCSFETFLKFILENKSNENIKKINGDEIDYDKLSNKFLIYDIPKDKMSQLPMIISMKTNINDFTKRFIILFKPFDVYQYQKNYSENYHILQNILLSQLSFKDYTTDEKMSKFQFKIPFDLGDKDFKIYSGGSTIPEFEKIILYLNCNFGIYYDRNYYYDQNIYFFDKFKEKGFYKNSRKDIKSHRGVDVIIGNEPTKVPNFSFYTEELYKLFGCFSYKFFIKAFFSNDSVYKEKIEKEKKEELENIRKKLFFIRDKSKILLFVNIILEDDFNSYLYLMGYLKDLILNSYDIKILYILLCHYTNFDYFYSNQNTCVFSCLNHSKIYSDQYYDFLLDENVSITNKDDKESRCFISRFYTLLYKKDPNIDTITEIIYHILKKKIEIKKKEEEEEEQADD